MSEAAIPLVAVDTISTRFAEQRIEPSLSGIPFYSEKTSALAA